MNDLIPICQRAADSILDSDRNKVAPMRMINGVLVPNDSKPFACVKSVEVVEDDATTLCEVRLTFDEDYLMSPKTAPIMPHAIHNPGKRELRPADVHDAVFDAMSTAVAATMPF